jgi:hypothetical protein
MRIGLAGAVSPLLGWPAGYSLHMAVWACSDAALSLASP